jgi:hypothetical protein
MCLDLIKDQDRFWWQGPFTYLPNKQIKEMYVIIYIYVNLFTVTVTYKAHFTVQYAG